MSLLLLTALAHAVPVTVCVDYSLDFDDTGLAGADEDYFATNAATPAKGIAIRAIGSGSTQIDKIGGVLPLNPGCADFDLDAAQTWTIQVISRMERGLRSIDVRSSGGSKGRWVRTAVSNWTATAGTYNITLPVADHWSVLAAAGQALTRNDAGRATADIDYYVPHTDGTLYLPSACDTDPCVDGTDVYVDSDTAARKFQVAYLQGWALLHHMGWSESDYDITQDEGFCGDMDSGEELALHTIESPEAGFLEGFAHWYSATAFNDETEANCTYVVWLPANWDRLDVCFEAREAPSGHVISFLRRWPIPPTLRGARSRDRLPGLLRTPRRGRVPRRRHGLPH